MASVQRNKKSNQWHFVFYDKETKKYTWIPSGVKIDERNPDVFERSKKKAEKALTLYEKEIEDNPSLLQGKVLFSDMVKEWLKHHEGDVAPQTFKCYQDTCNLHIIPWFESHKIYLQNIKPIHIQNYIDEKKKTLSTVTLKKHKSYISATLKYCRLMELIKYNPLENVELGKQRGSKFTPDWYDNTQLAELLKTAELLNEPTLAAVYLSGVKGLRRGEACAACWSNVNWQRKVLLIDRTIVKVDNKYVLRKAVKTDSSHRELPLSDADIAFLKRLKKQREANMKWAGDSYDHTYDDYICVWADGKMMKPDVCTRRFRKFADRNGFKSLRFQDLRASYATNLLKFGATPEKVAKILGHANSTTLLKYYARFCDDDLKEIVENYATIMTA